MESEQSSGLFATRYGSKVLVLRVRQKADFRPVERLRPRARLLRELRRQLLRQASERFVLARLDDRFRVPCLGFEAHGDLDGVDALVAQGGAQFGVKAFSCLAVECPFCPIMFADVGMQLNGSILQNNPDHGFRLLRTSLYRRIVQLSSLVNNLKRA